MVSGTLSEYEGQINVEQHVATSQYLRTICSDRIIYTLTDVRVVIIERQPNTVTCHGVTSIFKILRFCKSLVALNSGKKAGFSSTKAAKDFPPAKECASKLA